MLARASDKSDVSTAPAQRTVVGSLRQGRADARCGGSRSRLKVVSLCFRDQQSPFSSNRDCKAHGVDLSSVAISRSFRSYAFAATSFGFGGDRPHRVRLYALARTSPGTALLVLGWAHEFHVAHSERRRQLIEAHYRRVALPL